MKGLLLLGGHGTRVRDLGYSNKHLIPVGGVPLYQHGIRALLGHGFTGIGVVVSDIDSEIGRLVNEDPHVNAVILQPEPRGIAHAILCARDWIGAEPFVLLLGDNLFQRGIGRFIEAWHTYHPAAVIGLSKVADPTRYGVATVDGAGRVSYIAEKPKVPESNLAIVGCYILDPLVAFPLLHRQRPSMRGELEITELLREMPSIHALKIRGWWRDAGTPESLAEAENLLSGPSEEGSELLKAHKLGGPQAACDCVQRGLKHD